MNKNEGNRSALDFFHAQPHNWNCAQTIAKAYQGITCVSDEEIEATLRSKGGGKAEGGLCGALYSAIQILGEDSPEAKALIEEFHSRMGAIQCRALKAELRIPCNDTVALADQLLEKYLLIQREQQS